MFELNDNLEIKKELFFESIIYTIDNFYKHPHDIKNYLFNEPAPLHKIDETPSNNNVYFEDRRLFKDDERLNHVVDFLGSLVSQKPWTYEIITNQTRFFNHKFNNIDDCHWWPHYDEGYNGIVYFNDDEENGTNIYYERNKQEMLTEHHQPWRQKGDFRVLKHLQPKFNRLVFFDGYKFLHGMNIKNKRYFSEEYRNNQVFFYKQEN
tara:strand:+ start:2453 stop:3073 length:621 start_codon:yes stop_codon:yes gene_type:complete